MLIAEGEEAAAAAAGEARLGALLGIELVKLRTGVRHVGDKRDIVGFRHRVRKGDKDFAVAFGDGYFVLGVGLLRKRGGSSAPQQQTEISPTEFIIFPQIGQT